MKEVKKVLTLLIVAFMLFIISNPVSADQTVDVNKGDGSIKITNAEIEKTYSLYQLFDATVASDGSIAYSLPAGKTVDSDTYFNSMFEVKNGNVIKKDTFTEETLKTTEFKTWAKRFGTLVKSVKASDSVLVFNKIAYGYYFIETNSGTVLTVDSANPSAEVIDKNQTVSFDKYILEGSDRVSVNEAGLNEAIDFAIEVNAKNYDRDSKVFKYVIYDTMDPGFSLISAPIVKINDVDKTNLTTITYKKGSSSTTTVTEADYFEILIPWTSDGTKTGTHLYDANSKILVTYQAKLDPLKASQVKVGKDPNYNTAIVKFFKGNDNDTPSGVLGEKQTKTYDTKLTIKKVKEDGSSVLTGAEFTLTSTNGTKVVYVTNTEYVADDNGKYYKLKDGTYTSEAPNGNPVHDSVYYSTTVKYKLTTTNVVKGENQTDTSIASYVNGDGFVTFTGLGAGDYKIEETKVPAGYNKADDIEFTISFSSSDKTFASSNNKVVLDSTNNVFNATIQNQKGTKLPTTGGVGTTIFHVAGACLTVGAAVLLISKKRMNNN